MKVDRRVLYKRKNILVIDSCEYEDILDTIKNAEKEVRDLQNKIELAKAWVDTNVVVGKDIKDADGTEHTLVNGEVIATFKITENWDIEYSYRKDGYEFNHEEIDARVIVDDLIY